jgi:hypothetical protein
MADDNVQIGDAGTREWEICMQRTLSVLWIPSEMRKGSLGGYKLGNDVNAMRRREAAHVVSQSRVSLFRGCQHVQHVFLLGVRNQ